MPDARGAGVDPADARRGDRLANPATGDEDPSGGLAQGFFDGRPIVDVELSVDLGRGTTLSVGGQNVLDTYSQESVIADAVGERYSEYQPWGYSGAYHYARIGYGWGD